MAARFGLDMVNGAAVAHVIAEMRRKGMKHFRTRELSDRLMGVHGVGASDPGHYHAVIGRYLSKYDANLGIRCPDKQERHPSGVLWEIVG